MENFITYAIFALIAVVIFNILTMVCEKVVNYIKSLPEEYQLMKRWLITTVDEKKQETVERVYRYFGLFEIELKDYEDTQNFKQEYCLVIKDKMKSKYPNMSLTATDKIFFNSMDFANFEYIVNDFLKMYTYFSELSKRRNIITKLKFSIWTQPGTVGLQKAYKVLADINASNIVNQVVTNEAVFNEVSKYGLNIFTFNPCGLFLLANTNQEIELYRINKINPNS